MVLQQKLYILTQAIFFTYNLEVRNADVEALIHISMPHNPNISNKEGSKVTLNERKVKLNEHTVKSISSNDQSFSQ